MSRSPRPRTTSGKRRRDLASSVFPKRYKPGPSVDELAEELARLKRQMALPSAHAATQRKYAPRARVTRPDPADDRTRPAMSGAPPLPGAEPGEEQSFLRI
ncbi:MAG: hypothetical protein U5L03_04045 [Burkholderiaceae bacterium]|nr:hypothetical protein [Burkholderiaceae bacterium]